MTVKGPQQNLYLQKAVWVADAAWEQTVQGHPGPFVVGPLIMDVGRADSLPWTITVEKKSRLSQQ